LEAALCSIALACSSQDVESRKSAARVARAIEVVRGAPSASKAGALADLLKVDCSGADICQTRDVCTAAYQLHVHAVALTQAAKLQMNDGKAVEAAKLLVSAEDELRTASGKVAGCAEREAALRRRYKL
jgi:hypothetical protein